jgi:hypothetical protein
MCGVGSGCDYWRGAGLYVKEALRFSFGYSTGTPIKDSLSEGGGGGGGKFIIGGGGGGPGGMLVGIKLGLDKEGGAFIIWLILGSWGRLLLSWMIMLCFNASSSEGGGRRSISLWRLRSPGAII